jgi:CRP-like cAMP-binding protein
MKEDQNKYSPLVTNILEIVDLDEQEIACIESRLITTRLKKKDYLLREGEVCKHKNFILKGCVAAYFVDENGKERVTYLADRHHWANDIYSFFTGKPATLFMQALEDAELLQLSRADLDMLFEKIPKLERFFRIRYQNALIAQERRIIQGRFDTAEQLYLQFRKKFPDLELRIPLKYIASYLGITQQFLSVLRANLANT